MHVCREFDYIIRIMNMLSTVDTLARRPATPDVDHIQFYASDTKQSFIGVAGAWQSLEPRRGTATIANSATSVAVTLGTDEPDANYGVYVSLGYDNGGCWITSEAVGGFTINVKTAAAGGNGGCRWMLVRD
tara:strand:- start:191 stop:583 length:393 start_codon:yes stop_codon:yes gene_type:complete